MPGDPDDNKRAASPLQRASLAGLALVALPGAVSTAGPMAKADERQAR
jgi:hypothetical protein